MWVVVTGASSGIGLELARVFAEHGCHLFLVARNIQQLQKAASELRKTYGTDVRVLQKDLTEPNAADELFAQLNSTGIDIFVNNAASGICGAFADTDIHKQVETICLNTEALTRLTKCAIVHMQKHGGGKILNVASTGAYQPGPYTAVYYATKAYVLSFTQALRHELKGSGICISVLCPGATVTDFARRAGKRQLKCAMTARAVAQIAYKGLNSNRGVIIPGVWNKIAVIGSKLLPGHAMAAIVARIQKRLIV